MLKTPTLNIYQTYITEYPNGIFISQINTAENKRLYQIVKSNPTSAISRHFLITPTCRNSSRIKTRVHSFRKFARYTMISVSRNRQPPGERNATAIRQIIDEYKQSPYLTSTARTHLDDLEYLSEKADFELLKAAIVNSESLSMLQDFLCTHRYKNFVTRPMHYGHRLFCKQSYSLLLL